MKKARLLPALILALLFLLPAGCGKQAGYYAGGVLGYCERGSQLIIRNCRNAARAGAGQLEV